MVDRRGVLRAAEEVDGGVFRQGAVEEGWKGTFLRVDSVLVMVLQ